MKFRIIYTLLSAFAMGLLLMGNSGGRATTQNQGNTDAPGDQVQSAGVPWTCQTCHSGPIQTTMEAEIFEVGTSVAVTSYWPGETYDIKVTMTDTNNDASGYGFQIVSLVDSDESDVNGWSNPGAGVQISTASNTGRSYAEHAGTQDDNEFRVQWTAPANGVGNITFYAAGTAVNRADGSGGDGGAVTTLSLPENTTSIFNPSALSATINVFPNPAVNYLNVSITADFSGEVLAEITDMQGRVVDTRQLDLNLGANEAQFNVSQLSTGTYMVRLTQDNQVLTAQFVK